MAKLKPHIEFYFWTGTMVLILLAISIFFLASLHAANNQVEWTSLFGTTLLDSARSVSSDSDGNVYAAGYTYGEFPGEPTRAGADAYIRKYSSTGTVLWTHQLGSPGNDRAFSASADATGNVYVVGYTNGELPGATRVGISNYDAFVGKYDPDGNKLWTRQYGTVDHDRAYGSTIDSSGNVYFTGYTNGALPDVTSSLGFNDSFVWKIDPNGNTLWTRQFGTGKEDIGESISYDSTGNVYMTGRTNGVFPDTSAAAGFDVFMRKYDSDGNEAWTRQFGSDEYDTGMGISASSDNNVYVVGLTSGTQTGQSFLGGFYDAFIYKYDADGNNLWVQQFGTDQTDYAYSITSDPDGRVYVVGETFGEFPGQESSAAMDAYIREYDSAGNAPWTYQFGSSSKDSAYGVSSDPEGNIAVSGQTRGPFFGQTTVGLEDAFILEISAPTASPEIALIRGNTAGIQSFYVYETPATVGGNLGAAIATDPWVGNTGANSNITLVASADFDGDTTDELAIIRENLVGIQTLYIYETPTTVGGDLGAAIATDWWVGDTDANSNITHMVADDFDGDTTPELALIRENITTGVQTLYIYETPTTVGGDLGAAIATDWWVGDTDANSNITHMVADDFDGDTTPELAIIRENLVGIQSLSIYETPTTVGGNLGAAIATDPWVGNTGANSNITQITSDDFDGDTTPELAIIRENITTGVQTLYIYETPTAVGGDLGAAIATDWWVGDTDANSNITHMVAVE